ncbi:MAG: type II secretion system secretin GspD [Kofleriaceae bacterium]
MSCWIGIMIGVVVATSVAHAEDKVPTPGEDESLYSCKTRPAGSANEVAVTFKPETEVSELITWVMGFTCKNFVLDPRVVLTNRKVTIIAPGKLSTGDAYRVFLTALATVNLTVVPKGKVVHIVDAPTARRDTVPLYKTGSPDATDQIVRYVYRPTYAPAETLLQTFQAIKSDAGEVQLVGSLVMITDFGSHVRDMMSLAKLVDVPKGSDGIYTIPVLHADATRLADQLEKFLGGAGKVEATKGAPTLPAPSKILVDDRTNTLIIAASDAGYQRAKALVERLDIALDTEGGASFHVYKLGSAIADELAVTLTSAIGGQQPKAAATPAAPAALDKLGTALEGQVRVISDKPSNSLLVMSSGRDFLAIKQIIRELDQPRRQVYIEALILELAVNNNSTMGTSSHAVLPVAGTSLILGGARTGVDTTSIEAVSKVTGLVGGIFGESLSFLGTSIPSYGVLFQALANANRTNVLSAPSIIALDNETAKYKVGTNIAIRRGSSVVFAGTGTGTSDNIERRDLAIALEIKPHISIDDTVLLEIKHEAEDLVDMNAPLGATWSTRSFETKVVVRDQEAVVIGGLIQERVESFETKVPLLGDIPLLGHLFKSTQKVKRKTNLVILLTPYIIKDQMDLQVIRERKLREYDEFTRATSSFARMKYEPRLDYGRKRGLIEDINRSLQTIDEDVMARASLSRPATVKSGPIEIPPGD